MVRTAKSAAVLYKTGNFIEAINFNASSLSHQHKGMLGRAAGQFDLLGSASCGGNACNNQPYIIFSPLSNVDGHFGHFFLEGVLLLQGNPL